MKDAYVKQIIEQLHECNDLALLDLISRILNKSIQEAA